MTIARAHLVDPAVTRWYHCGTPPSGPGPMRVLRVGVPVSLPDDLFVDQQVVALAEDIGQKPAVLVLARRDGLDFQPDQLVLGRSPTVRASVLTSTSP